MYSHKGVHAHELCAWVYKGLSTYVSIPKLEAENFKGVTGRSRHNARIKEQQLSEMIDRIYR